jgi:hypothetical protein
MKAALVFHLDEVDMLEWEDRKDKRVIVPKTMDSQAIYYRASRNVKYISIITYISVRGESLTPSFVTSQDCDPLRRRPMNRGVRLGVDFLLRQRLKSYVSGKHFLEYINSIFIHYVHELWESEEFAGCEAVLLMDNCSPHTGDAVIAVLTREWIRVITFAPHIMPLISVK